MLLVRSLRVASRIFTSSSAKEAHAVVPRLSLGASAPGSQHVGLERFLATRAGPVGHTASNRSTALPAVQNATPSRFQKFGLHPGVVEALAAQGVIKPTAIQERAIPAALNGENILIAAETGSGKTLAYLAPLVTLLKNSELPMRRRPSRPRAIVLVPTRELVTQVLGVAKSLSYAAKFSSRPAVGGPHNRSLKKSFLEEPVDVLIATPGMLAHMREQQLVLLSDLEFVVVDEADVTLASQGFYEQVQPLLKAVDAKPHLDPPQKRAQFMYVAATVPASVRRLLQQRHPGDHGLSTAETSDLHKATPPDRVRVKFLRVAGDEDAKFKRAVELVLDALRINAAGKVMLFCDRDNRRTKIVDMLRDSHHLQVVHMSREVDRLDRFGDWKLFCNDADVRVAVCAQSFSRGIDHAGIKSVIMTDVPMTGNEYLHRVGRIRGQGNVTVLVSNRDRAVAEALFLAHVSGEDMSRLNAPAAWRSYIDAGRDRIATDHVVARARRSGHAVWADERPSAVGTVRGVVERGRGAVRRSSISRLHGPRSPDSSSDQRIGQARRYASRWDDRTERRSFGKGRPSAPGRVVNPRFHDFRRTSARERGNNDDHDDRRFRKPVEFRGRTSSPRSEKAGNGFRDRNRGRIGDDSNNSSAGRGGFSSRRDRHVRMPREDGAFSRGDARPWDSGRRDDWNGVRPERSAGGFRPLARNSGRDVRRASNYEKRRYADAGPYSGGTWSALDED